jgi:hypothetical protein
MAALRKSGRRERRPAPRLRLATAGSRRKDYEKELRKLEVELCRLQACLKHDPLRVIIVFQGRDTAGKGGTTRRSPSGPISGWFAWSRCPRRRSAKKRRCSPSVTSSNSPRPARSSFSTAAGTTAPASNASWTSSTSASRPLAKSGEDGGQLNRDLRHVVNGAPCSL